MFVVTRLPNIQTHSQVRWETFVVLLLMRYFVLKGVEELVPTHVSLVAPLDFLLL